jgi:hypothetical protein
MKAYCEFFLSDCELESPLRFRLGGSLLRGSQRVFSGLDASRCFGRGRLSIFGTSPV